MAALVSLQPQVFKTSSVVIGASASSYDTANAPGLAVMGQISGSGALAVSGATVFGQISASGPVYGAGPLFSVNSLTGNGGTTYSLTNYTNNVAANYLVFLDGVFQTATVDYTVSVPNITFSPGVPAGVGITVLVVNNFK